MVNKIRHKSRGERCNDPSSSSHGHPTHAPPTSRPRHQAYDKPDSVRPTEVFDASQPTYSDEARLSGDADHSRATEILTDASHTFSQHHTDMPGADASSVFATLINSVRKNSGDSSSTASNGSDSVASEASSTNPDISNLRVVVMTKSEYSSWRHLTSLNPSPGGIESGISHSDWLRPMRHALSEIALSIKRLEMRFNTMNMHKSIQQQYNLERLTILSQFFSGKLIDGMTGDSKKAAIGLKPASVMIAWLTDELSVLASRLESVQKKAEAGTVPFCGHVLDLGKDPVSDAHRQSEPSRPLTSTIADPRTAHANNTSKRFSIMDVAKGYTLFGLAADTLENFSGSSGPSALELANDILSRCDDDIRGMLHEPQCQPDQAQLASMFAQWLFSSCQRSFHIDQVDSINSLLNEARQNQADSVCSCASVSSTRGHASSLHGHGHIPRLSGRPPSEKNTHRAGKKHRRRSVVSI